MEKLKDLLEYWKSILTFGIVVVSTTYAIIAWAEEQRAVIEAKQQLIHDVMYQESRISHKEITLDHYRREQKELLDEIGDDEPTLRQSRDLEWLDDEISRLKLEIETIRVTLATEHE